MEREQLIDRDSAGDEQSVSDVQNRAGTCGRCFMLVARYAPQVVTSNAIFHRECFEAWYFGRHGRRPTLLASASGDRHRFQVRERAA
jgi:hypothetical protein